ncbi:uncharacterized protein [Rutidosis leptorrhynchoides]|uniref:uncharacterized protein n=1 Tax=Rutidosis leptorrhynchoides TaxID=125765 RepID=UPI003A9A2C3E
MSGRKRDCNSLSLLLHGGFANVVLESVVPVVAVGLTTHSANNVDAVVVNESNEVDQLTTSTLVPGQRSLLNGECAVITGKPLSQANPEQKEGYLIQERSNRSDYLQKFLSDCSSSEVQVETVLIESDMEAKAFWTSIQI